MVLICFSLMSTDTVQLAYTYWRFRYLFQCICEVFHQFLLGLLSVEFQGFFILDEAFCWIFCQYVLSIHCLFTFLLVFFDKQKYIFSIIFTLCVSVLFLSNYMVLAFAFSLWIFSKYFLLWDEARIKVQFLPDKCVPVLFIKKIFPPMNFDDAFLKNHIFPGFSIFFHIYIHTQTHTHTHSPLSFIPLSYTILITSFLVSFEM